MRDASAIVSGGSAPTLRLGLRFVFATVMLLALLVGAGYSGPLTPRAQTAQQQNNLTADELKALQQKAEQGDAEAQCTLGMRYVGGLVVPKDYAQGVAWFRKAAEQGYAVAQFNLGMGYASGLGVPQDDVEAHKWLNLATAASMGVSEKKYADARDSLAKMMTPEQIAEAQKRASEWTAAFEKRRK
jgi:TPR repeat protein